MQWLMLVFTLIVWTILQRLARAAGGAVEARATLALGLLIVAAYLAGTIAQRFRIPRLIGYLVVGFVAGPAWLGLIRGDELAVLDTIASGALSLIAFAAGGELTLAALRGPERTPLLRATAGAVAVPFVAVTLVALTVSAWFPLTAHQPFEDALTVALALGALATVASPTITWAVITDGGAQGPVSRTIRDVTILQDLAAILVFVVVLALAGPLASRGAVTPGIAVHTLLVLGGSLLAGAALGYAAAQYVRVIQGRLEWVLLVLAFVVSQALRLGGLDPVLVALAAGITLRNVSPAGMASERVRSELARCAVPVYVVFFALAGSNLHLGVLAAFWPWALLFAGLRAVGFWAGLRWAGRHGTMHPGLVDYGWLGLISQGGLAITLAAVLRRAFPEWNVSLEALAVAMIGMHQLLGPLCFQWALRRTGEFTQVEGTHDRRSVGTSSGTETGASGAHGGGAAGVVATGSGMY